MPITFVAPIIRAAIATLEADLPDAIAVFNAQAENAVNLAEPVAYEFGAADPLVLFPTIEVAGVEGSLGASALERADADHRPTITVVLWHEGERGELGPTYEMSLGMARCVIEVLAKTDAFGDEAQIANDEGSVTWRTEVLPADLAEATREFSKWRCAVLITFRLETLERLSP